MSIGFKELVGALQGDFLLVAEFLENPQQVVSRYKLSADEQNAILNRNFEALTSLSGSSELAQGVVSGAHTPVCKPTIFTWVV